MNNVEDLANAFKARGLMIACAESCTGGLFSHLLTNIPGASQFFKGSIVAYTPASKMEVLGVPKETIKESGLVSAPVAREMSVRVAGIFSAQVGVAITGSAGPTPEEGSRVGDVWISIYRSGTYPTTRSFEFSGDRETIKEQAVVEAFKMLLEILEKP
jgi:PncC family amidohydrolase